MSDSALETREIARTGIHVSRLPGLGTATLGNLYKRVSDQQAGAVLSAAIDQGVTYIDTAHYYGFGLSATPGRGCRARTTRRRHLDESGTAPFAGRPRRGPSRASWLPITHALQSGFRLL